MPEQIHALPPPLPSASRLALVGIPLALVALHLATTAGYGIFRDELYYLSCARRLAWGYVDQPPLVAWIARVVTAMLGDSLFAIRLVPALCAGAIAVTVASTTRELGGGARAQVLAAGVVALAPVLLAICSILSMNALDLALHGGMWWVLARWVRTGDSRLWIPFGVLAGLGLETKASTAFLGLGVALAVLALRRDAPRQPRLWGGATIAILLGLPHLLWQIAHDFPTLEFAANASRDKNIALAPWDLFGEAVLQFGPLGSAVVVAGAIGLAASSALRPARLLGVATLGVAGLMLVANAKPYYLAPAFLVLIAAGAMTIERLRFRRTAIAATIVLALLTALAAPLAKPLLPLETYVAYAAALGEAPSTSERHELGRLKQFYADMHGWRELAEAVGRVAATLSPAERDVACVFTGNYGEAGAIEYWADELELPPPISGHNNWHLWGTQGCSGEVLLVLGRSRERLDQLFEDVTLGGVSDCTDCMPYEDELPIWIARRPREGISIDTLWPSLEHFD